ncbi:GNAT family N-acetyltransferase [Massilia agilis]|uniref:GNAT family N-acetyltransferase n=1 Tax=Massilia agilis TaxID=1811226 RepID=A0ABT2D9I8_9BURK|nr:GNAT family N-acetyltransferase [Massilia agilis]MCS0807955.1 GNAT family N-acetyltransferase [Massilia agilis]
MIFRFRQMIQTRNLAAQDVQAILPDLMELLADVVEHGSSVGFLAPLSASEARAYWTGVEKAVAEGSRVLLVAVRNGELLGTVQLDLCQKANGRNRAEVQKLIVRSDARRAGVASLLMCEAQAQALQLRRGLLFLDTEAGSGAERFYQSCGFTRLGELPDFACNTDGEWRATAIYFKTLFTPERLEPADS